MAAQPDQIAGEGRATPTTAIRAKRANGSTR